MIFKKENINYKLITKKILLSEKHFINNTYYIVYNITIFGSAYYKNADKLFSGRYEDEHTICSLTFNKKENLCHISENFDGTLLYSQLSPFYLREKIIGSYRIMCSNYFNNNQLKITGMSIMSKETFNKVINNENLINEIIK